MDIKITEDGKAAAVAAPQVRVTNKNEFDIEDSFDGVPYAFPGRTYAKDDTERKNPIYKAVTIPPDAAAHFFAYGLHTDLPPKQQLQKMFEYIAMRYGWNTIEFSKDGKGRECFRNFDIRQVMFRIVEEAVEEGEARAPRGKSA